MRSDFDVWWICEAHNAFRVWRLPLTRVRDKCISESVAATPLEVVGRFSFWLSIWKTSKCPREQKKKFHRKSQCQREKNKKCQQVNNEPAQLDFMSTHAFLLASASSACCCCAKSKLALPVACRYCKTYTWWHAQHNSNVCHHLL